MSKCIICGWPLAKDEGGGCIPGYCCHRSDDPAEQAKLRERRQLVERVTNAVKAAWSVHGDVPFPLYDTEAREIASAAIQAYEMR